MINIQQIQLVNSHWENNLAYSSEKKWKRSSYSKISPWLKTRQMLSISGLRRTGKSTLLGQLREEYIKTNKLTAKQTLFFSFENEDRSSLLPASDLEDLLKYYFDNILSLQPGALENKILICLDEIQNVDSWQKILKTYYDISPNIKFIISGSSSLYLRENSESLVGRIIDFTLLPLCFGEFLEICNRKDLTTIRSFEELSTFPPSSVTAQRQELFDHFLLIGGFPEAATMFADKIPTIQIQQYIRESIILKIINKDLNKFFNLKTSEQDLRLFKVLCNESGQITSLKNLANDTGFSIDAIKSHLHAFIGSGLIKTLRRFDTKPRRITKAHPKVYINSPSIIFSYLGYDTIPPGSLIGHVAESYAFLRLLELNNFEEIYFATPVRDQEIDFYVPQQKSFFEVKYTEQISQSNIDYLLKNSKEYKLKPFLICKQMHNSLLVKSIPLSYL